MSLASAGRSPQNLPSGPRRKPLPNSNSKPRFCALLPTGNPRRQAKSRSNKSKSPDLRQSPPGVPPNTQAERLAPYRRQAVTRRRRNRTQKAKQKFFATSGQGRKSLAGAGQSPQILAVRPPAKVVSEPLKADQRFAHYSRRQSRRKA